MKRLLQKLLWRLSGRDFIPLNPDWQVLHRGRDFGLVGNGAFAARKFLPLSYPFHIDSDWRIRYELRGERSGRLRFTLGAPDNKPFCKTEQHVTLPFTLLVERRGERLFVNDAPLDSHPLPLNATWLHGDFEFTADTGQSGHPGETLVRHTAHRVRHDAGTGAGYFQGGAYADYEADPGIAPDAILDAIARRRPLAGRLLDVGCATGLLVAAAQRRGLDAEGVDFSEWAVEKANARTGGRCRALDMDRAEASDFKSSYDIIIMHSVIEHLAEPERALRLLFEITRPDGIVFIQTLNADSLLHRLLGDDWEGYADYTHRSPWITAQWLETAALRIGFQVVAMARGDVWITSMRDEVWRGFAELIRLHPASVLLAQEYGDIVEITLRRPACGALKETPMSPP